MEPGRLVRHAAGFSFALRPRILTSGVPVAMVRSPGYLSQFVELGGEQTELLRRTGRLPDIAVRLHPAAALEGQVRDPSGRLVSGATVRVEWGRSGSSMADRTDASGRYRIEGLDSRLPHRIWAYLARDGETLLSRAWEPDLPREPGSTAFLDLALTPTREIDLAVTLLNFREGLKVRVGSLEVPAEEPVVAVRTRTGPGRVEVRTLSCGLVTDAPMDIPSDYHAHRIAIDLPREGSPSPPR